MRFDSRELPLSAIPLCQLLPCHLWPPRPMLSLNLYVKGCLDCTIGAFHMSIPVEPSPSEWGPDPQSQAGQVAHWTWWWQCLAAWHCRSVWSLPYYSTADTGGLALSVAKSHCKSCTHGHVSWKRGGVKRGLVAVPWTSSRQFSHVLWLEVHRHLLLRACLLGSKRKLPPPACQVSPGLPSVVCHPRGMQFHGTVYICSQGTLSSAWAHCISCAPGACSHSRRCCCCPLQCDRRRMETHLNAAGGPGLYHRPWSSSFLHLLSPFFSIASLIRHLIWIRHLSHHMTKPTKWHLLGSHTILLILSWSSSFH